VTQKYGISYKLNLPTTIRIYNVFYPSLLSRDPDNPIEGQAFPEPPLVITTEGDDNAEWVVDEILAIRKLNRTIKA